MRWLAVVLGSALVVLSVTACTSGKASKCEEAFTAAATSVAGVTSAEFDCNFGFGGGWRRGRVVVDAATRDDAVAVMEAVLRAMAASPGLEDSWSTPQEYATENRTIVIAANALGFSAVPTVGQVRARFGITPR
ncbi:hypothetical protein ACGFIF_28900 [Kribbella sp. NPDC049174]|uniref:hypothetical protein n=1 Tax=Kribbella sp. NPDC049174 TaxID=3364112 RepID=UPI003711D597